MPYSEASDALLERLRLVLGQSALAAVYGDEMTKVPEVSDHLGSSRPPFLVWMNPLAEGAATTGGASGHEHRMQFYLRTWMFAQHVDFSVALKSVQRWAHSACMGVAADATLGGAVDSAIARLSDCGYDTTNDKKHLVCAEIEVACSVFSVCPSIFKELIANAHDQERLQRDL